MRTRLARTTTRLANGTKVTKTKLVEAGPLEWEVQAEAVRRLRALPGYGDEAGPEVTFTLAGDFNSARRSPQQATIAKATGIAAGEPDLRIYAANGRLLLIELKGPKTPVSADQKKRHPLLASLGHPVHLVRGKTIEQGASDVVALVTEWLAANNNETRRAA
ncbi:VRR-NUC domain-containing protein [Devosia neptuniae]|uniref:VRR-NUC domain-containing protein n=1 Tax=Devosia neptuniae TaxID=191302 RepID=A0ABY6CHZ3_9HYPH|nr:VRR-NUC domain-containing protein [Devosia neptuniae]UXN70917.1 VRR-NUC domain-containing protein [Devosia neptuniae]